MEKETITALTEQFITTLLSEQLSSDHQFHALSHTLSVRDACLELAEIQGISDEEKEILELAALLHDVGYTQAYEGHEAVSVKLAADYLTEQNYPEEKKNKVLACIAATEMAKSPANEVEKLMKDGDLSNLGREDFFDLLGKLRYEWEVFKNETHEDKNWNELNLAFLKEHEFFTEAATELYGPQKKENQKKLKKMVKKDKKAKAVPADKILSISSSKTAQMMFKTASRNHIDLSNLADNKANMMLSVNAGIITIAIPLGSTYIDSVPFLLVPLIVLLITCMASMIYATLATRPIQMHGYTDMDKIKSGNSNLFFFGNFYKMNFNEYQDGLQHVVADEENLEGSIMRDLYFLGKSLGKKYNQLRMCYNLFMIGIIITVIVFVISYNYYN